MMEERTGASPPPSSPPGGMKGLDLRTPTADDSVNGVMPQRVVWVRNAKEVVQVVCAAAAQREPLVVRGGGTLLSIGNAPRALTSILAMQNMNRILDYSPEDMVVTAQAGTSLAALDHELAQARQRVAIESSQPQTATIGGVAAANSNTGAAYAFGYPRDQILGMTVVDGNGRILEVGGRVVKNVAGYDMPRLFIGSFGTLAVITEVTVRTQPRPEARENISLEFIDQQSLKDAQQRLFRANLPLCNFDIDAEPDGHRLRWRLHLSTEGSVKDVEHARMSAAALSRGGSPAPASPGKPQRLDHSANFVARFSTRPGVAIEETSDLLTTAGAIVETPRAVIECGGALVRLYAECKSSAEASALTAACQEKCSALAGALLFERLPAEQRNHVDVWSGPIGGLVLMRRLKEKFDPCRVFAPGRFVGGI
jgi:glycolate oxidase FAD binding subunit